MNNNVNMLADPILLYKLQHIYGRMSMLPPTTKMGEWPIENNSAYKMCVPLWKAIDSLWINNDSKYKPFFSKGRDEKYCTKVSTASCQKKC